MSVERTNAGDGHVATVCGVDRRSVVVVFDTLETGKDDREIVMRIGTEQDGGIALDMKLDIGPEADRAGEPDARRDEDFAAAGLSA